MAERSNPPSAPTPTAPVGTDDVHARARSFDAVAGAYEAARPGWPPEAIEIAARRLGLGRDATVLDLAAGTGKLTRRLAGRFASVVAVEPLDGMRSVLEDGIPFVRALRGSAEAIPLADQSVDAVFVAEAMHWFDAEAAVAEMARVLRPGGGVAVLYNRRDWKASDAGWHADVNAAFLRHRVPNEGLDAHDESRWRPALARLGELVDDVLEGTVQRLDADGVVTLYRSFSGLASLSPERLDAALADIRGVLDQHGVRETDLVYRTQITTVRT